MCLWGGYLLVDSVATQSDAFLRGFESELELLLCGSPNLDFEALERVTQYDDGFSCDSPCIALLWEVIHELPLEMKKKFLFFCTGSDRVPIKGLGNLSFVISRNGSDEERLQSATHT
ncbi:putative ubiquitin-protein ligase [Emiliania huxleyi CCMP1516]|uniref:HECT-type E3 ubiquitin transferase n=2 Tax=Emiliania huxleyi TaxID=2903 RepID=A0A0D3KLB4_EMIH1|nr:putative ubiquitin-protein ligase [Emiliania huxleyi CCMP1516]EOD36549.1 putative ubiquitin-protein ligase [Emiliania huxleyi CCMP1516]|eukprot:XP_005788978.1 putative ubiquitin-protein ligase [Emiliania huxleyi CCMP1516]